MSCLFSPFRLSYAWLLHDLFHVSGNLKATLKEKGRVEVYACGNAIYLGPNGGPAHDFLAALPC